MTARSSTTPDRGGARLAALEAVFRALADQTRLRILAMLGGGELCVCDIQQALGIPQPKASRHLAYLRRVGLVADRRQGLWVHYRLADVEDPVLKTVVAGALHCLGHLPGVKVDAARATAEPLRVFACCGGRSSTASADADDGGQGRGRPTGGSPAVRR
jgi:ArsR family transcriptional regulator